MFKAYICSAASISKLLFFFFFNDTATTEIYTLSLHDALPISALDACAWAWASCASACCTASFRGVASSRSEEHTSELQSLRHLVCRLLLEKKKNSSHLLLLTSNTGSNLALLS